MHSENTELSNPQNELLESISTMQNNFIKRGISYGWCEDTVENLLYLSESKFGFICELLKKEDGTPYIRSHGITNIAWDEQTRRFYEENKEKGLEFFNFESLWGKAITTGEPVIANDPDNDNRRGGYPREYGHPILESFLALPIKGSDGEVVGVMGVANRPNGYDDIIVNHLAPFVASYGVLIEKSRSDQQRKMLEIEREKLISDLKHSQEALQKNTALLDATGRMARVGGWELDANTYEVTWTAETHRIHEVPPDYKPPLEEAIEYFHPEDRPKLEQAIQRALDNGEPYDIEIRFITAKGKHLWTRTKCEPEVVDGKITKLKGTFQDVTVRRQAEETIRKNASFLNHLIEAIPIPLFYKDQEGKYKLVNKAFEDLNGKSKHDLIGKTVFEISPPDLAEIYHAKDQELFEKGGRQIYESHVKNAKGERRDVIFNKALIAENSQKKGLIGTIQDITDRKQAEKRLAELKKRNQALLDHSPVCHKIVDLDFNLQYMSANGFNMLKLDHDAEIYGKPYPFEFFPEPFKKEMVKKLKYVRQTGEIITMEALANNIEGSDIWLDSSLIPVLDDDGRIDYVTVVSANTTQRKMDEKERKRLEEKLAQAQKMEAIGTIAGGIAHDFNNLLFPIIGMSELLIEDLPEDSRKHENAREILAAGKRGADLVRQILAFSRQTEHQMSPVRIQHVLKEVVKLSRSTIPTYIEIRQDIKQNCGLIMADPTQIHQVAMNLITNAYHVLEMEGGEIRVVLKEAQYEASDLPGTSLHPGQYAVLSVSDTGNGISPELMDKIFDPYFTTKEQGKGTGLGLAVVYGIVREHKGDITVYSEMGKGTTFNVYLPLMPKTVTSDVNDAVENLPTGDERILLVDDEPPIVKLEKQMLERLGYDVTEHVNSIEALVSFQSSPDSFDLVISDMNMPTMTGVQLAGEIRSIRADIPFIICTGFSDKIDENKTDILGIDGVLMKPIIKSEMARMVRKTLDRAGSEIPR